MKTNKNKDLDDVFGSPRLRCVYELIDVEHPLIPHAGLDDNGRPTLIFFTSRNRPIFCVRRKSFALFSVNPQDIILYHTRYVINSTMTIS